MATETLVNVVFSGTGFLFPVHIGALQAVENNGNTIIGYAGTSGGSIVAALSASGYSSQALLEIAEEIDFDKLYEFNFSALFNMALCRGKTIEKLLKGLLGDKTFSDLEHPLYITANDLNSNKGVILSKHNYPNMPVWLAVRASMSLPFIYTPVRYDGMVLVDGGLFSYLPICVFENSKVKTLAFQLTNPQEANFFSKVRYLPSRSTTRASGTWPHLSSMCAIKLCAMHPMIA